MKRRLISILRKLPGGSTVIRWYRRRQAEHRFCQEFKAFAQMSGSGGHGRDFSFRWEDRWPCLGDKTSATGFDRHYVYHPAWAARILAQIRPAEHVDISSTLHFCSIVSAFLPVRFYDYRPAELELDNLISSSADLVHLAFPDGSINSLSCMHVVEHIGLGRYGDKLDPAGDLKAMKELERVVAPGGSLLFVVPVGGARICFNAHRIYNFRQIVEAFSEMTLTEFSVIPDTADLGGLVRNPPEGFTDSQNYGCGCFWFTKPDHVTGSSHK